MTAEEEMKIPILSESQIPWALGVSKATYRRVSEAVLLAMCLFTIWLFVSVLRGPGDMPEFRIDSAFVCPINASNDNNNNTSVIWDLKLDIISNRRYRVCIYPFNVSVFSNRTTTDELLVAKGEAGLTKSCIEPGSHTSAIIWMQSHLPQDQDHDQNGLIRFDLKFFGRFYFTYNLFISSLFGGDIVCRDVKVAFLSTSPASNTSSSSCRALVGGGDPFSCFYDSLVHLH